MSTSLEKAYLIGGHGSEGRGLNQLIEKRLKY
jgi:hypothetical protein